LKSSAFLFETSEWAKVISGQEEGAFLWFTENYLMGNTKSKKAPTVSTIDVGGAST
jgi:apyrase